jgi:hypothetical protein
MISLTHCSVTPALNPQHRHNHRKLETSAVSNPPQPEILADTIYKKSQKPNECGGVAHNGFLATNLEGDRDPFGCLKDESLKLKSSFDDYPDLPDFLDRRVGGRKLPE